MKPECSVNKENNLFVISLFTAKKKTINQSEHLLSVIIP